MKPDQAVTEQKYILRAGHGGNLDAMATGVLGKSYPSIFFITYLLLLLVWWNLLNPLFVEFIFHRLY